MPKAGLDCELIINAAEPARKEGNLLLEELLGTKIHFLGPCDGTVRNRRTEELAAAYQSAGEQVYVVRNGATTGRGALGYTAAVVEMKRQCEDLGIGRMTIFAPGGNGGVAAGLIYGNQLMGQPFRIVIVSVEDDRETLTAHIRSTISEAEETPGSHGRACGTGRRRSQTPTVAAAGVKTQRRASRQSCPLPAVRGSSSKTSIPARSWWG